jgi:hypothetical protein
VLKDVVGSDRDPLEMLLNVAIRAAPQEVSARVLTVCPCRKGRILQIETEERSEEMEGGQ